MIDYSDDIEDALNSINEYGAPAIWLKRINNVLDSEKPWRNDPEKTPLFDAFVCSVLLLQYPTTRIDKSIFVTNDATLGPQKVKAMMGAVDFKPEHADFVDVATLRYNVISINPFMPGGQIIFYDLELEGPVQ